MKWLDNLKEVLANTRGKIEVYNSKRNAYAFVNRGVFDRLIEIAEKYEEWCTLDYPCEFIEDGSGYGHMVHDKTCPYSDLYNK